LFFGLIRWCVTFVFVVEQVQAIDAGHLFQHASGQGIGYAVVVDVNV
jgi:hypothetical protein